MSLVQVDARGLRCPWPALRLARAMRLDAAATEIVIIADDPAAPAEINALATAQGWRAERLAGDDAPRFRLTR